MGLPVFPDRLALEDPRDQPAQRVRGDRGPMGLCDPEALLPAGAFPCSDVALEYQAEAIAAEGK